MNRSYFCGNSFLKLYLVKAQEPQFSKGHIFGEERPTEVYLKIYIYLYILKDLSSVESVKYDHDQPSHPISWETTAQGREVGVPDVTAPGCVPLATYPGPHSSESRDGHVGGVFLPFGRDKKWSNPGQQATVSVEGLGKPWESWLMPQQLLEKPRRPGGADLPPAFPSSPLLCPLHGVSSGAPRPGPGPLPLPHYTLATS